MKESYQYTITIWMLCCMAPLISLGQSFIAASPYGDNKLLNEFICFEMVYPPSAMEKGEEGEVTLMFTVDEEGGVSNLNVKEGVSPEVDREALRIFRLLQWEPAIRLGNPVRSEQEFSFKFNIKKYKRHCKKRGYEDHEYPYLPVDTSYRVYSKSQVDKLPDPIFTVKGMTLHKFIVQNLEYPEIAYKQNISGKVIMSFVVETHGSPSNILVEQPVGGGCTEEAIRIMKMIRWMPAIKDEIAVRSRINFSITFKLPSDTDTRVFDNNQGAL